LQDYHDYNSKIVERGRDSNIYNCKS